MVKKSILMPGRLAIAAGVLSMMVFAGCEKNLDEPTAITNESSSSDAAAQTQNYVPNEVLVKFKKGSSETGRANALARIRGRVKERILTKAMQGAGEEGLFLVHTPMEALEALARVRDLEIEYAEPNYIYTHDAVSNDTYFTNGSLWGMYGAATTPANQYGSNAAAAWAAGKTGAAAVYIGIIDEGAMFSHEDLAGNFGNPGEGTVADNIDNDGNGYVDDLYGWDFDGNNNSTYDGAGDDHGTHVAGTIGAKGGNGKGVAGVNWNVKMISAKFLGPNGGTTANAIKAVDYFTDLKVKKKVNIIATNNSWGGGGYSQALYDAIARANDAGILFIAAAGNGGMDGRGDNLDGRRGASYPASYDNPNIIAVSALTSTGSLASYSNYGSTSVDLGAPGSGVYSTLPDNKYGAYSGTSMATPHVTGAAALYKSINAGATAAQIKAAILGSAVPTSSLSGKTATGGRLNVSGF